MVRFIFLAIITSSLFSCGHASNGSSAKVVDQISQGECAGILTFDLTSSTVLPQNVRIEWDNNVYDDCTGEGVGKNVINVSRRQNTLVVSEGSFGNYLPQRTNFSIYNLSSCSSSVNFLTESQFQVAAQAPALCQSFEFTFNIP